MELTLIPFPVLSTERFNLRPIKTEDANEIFALRSDDRVNEYLDRPKAGTIEDAFQHIQRLNEGMARNESINWAIVFRETDKMVGSICFWKISKELAKAEIGYELLPDFQGKGIMQEVMPPVIEFGFDKIKFQSIEAELSPRNLKSIKLLEKHGFIKEKQKVNADSAIYILTNKKK